MQFESTQSELSQVVSVVECFAKEIGPDGEQYGVAQVNLDDEATSSTSQARDCFDSSGDSQLDGNTMTDGADSETRVVARGTTAPGDVCSYTGPSVSVPVRSITPKLSSSDSPIHSSGTFNADGEEQLPDTSMQSNSPNTPAKLKASSVCTSLSSVIQASLNVSPMSATSPAASKSSTSPSSTPGSATSSSATPRKPLSAISQFLTYPVPQSTPKSWKKSLVAHVF